MKAAIYVRVSTEEQAKEGFSINAQKQRLREFIKSQGWTLYREYVDEGYSAKNLDRPAMQEMISDIKKGNFDVVLVYRLDRMVRSVLDLHALLKLFEEHKVMFKSATEMFDTTSAMGRFFITLVGAMAAWERENLAERVHMGMKRMVEEGNRAGGSAPFGYDLKDGKLYINESEAKLVKRIFESYLTKGAYTIAKELNKEGIRTRKNKKLWNHSILQYIIENPVYCGYIRWNYKHNFKKTNEEMIVPGEHDPIISKELFDDVQVVKKKRAKTRTKGHVHYPFTGILKCARCGANMVGGKKKRRNGTEYRYYKCSNKVTYHTCDLPMVGEELIEYEFFNNLELSKGTFELEFEDNTTDLQKELEKTIKAKDPLKKMFQWGDISEKEYRVEMDKLLKKENQLSEQLESAPTPVNMDEINETLSKAKDNWTLFSYEQRKGFIQSIISSLTVEVTKEYRGGNKGKAEIKIVDVEIN